MKKILTLILCLCMALPAADVFAEETVTLRFSWWGGDERLTATLAVIEQFEALHPNIKIEAEYGSSDGYTDKLAAQLAGGTAPDIIQIDPSIMPSFASDDTNYFVDLKKTDFDFSLFDPAFLAVQSNGRFGEKQLGIPTGVAGAALVVNQDMAEKFELDFNEQYDWEDFIAWGKKVHETDPEAYLLCTNKSFVYIAITNYIKQMTGRTFINDRTKEINVTKEELTDMFSVVKRLYDEGVVAPASYSAAYDGDNLQNDPKWIAGDKYVSVLVYSSTAEILTAANESVRYYGGKYPVVKNAPTDGWNSGGPQLICVNSKSAHVEEAVQFLDYFFNNEIAMETLGTVRSVPPTARAREICAEKGLISPLLAQICDIDTSYAGMPEDNYFSSSEAKQIIIDQIEAVGYNIVTPEKAAEEMYDLLEAFMENK